MIDDDFNETERSLDRIKKVSKVFSVVIRIVFYIFCVGWVVLTALFTILAFFPEVIAGSQSLGIKPLLMCLIFGFLLAACLRLTMLIFADISKGESPFTQRQVKRIRWVAIIFLAYALIEMIFSSTLTPVVQGDALQVGYQVSAASSDVPLINMNLGMLGAAAIFYGLSLIFEYGTLLQQLSDETL